MQPKYNLDWLKAQLDKAANLKYLYFWGHTLSHGEEVGKSCFSQWYASPFTVKEITYPTAEHWMMAEKARLFQDQKILEKIIQATKPGEAKALGRQVQGFDPALWMVERFKIVKLGNIHKFNQNRQLGDFLLNTGERILVEASPVDTIWGVGLAQDDETIANPHHWNGTNLLGFALMEVRDWLRENGYFEPTAEISC